MASHLIQKLALTTAMTVAAVPINTAIAIELSGSLELEHRHFSQSPLIADQHRNYSSIALEPELFLSWNDGSDSVTLTPFGRLDEHDDERTHADLREFHWLHNGDGWNLLAGISKVFWGSTESQHLVDIINQTDALEGIDGEDKLGQPMLNLNLLLGNGELSLFWLPYFRERRFADIEGRPRTLLPIDADQSSYESADNEQHQDIAIRLNYSSGAFDLALSHFSGTSREPTLGFNHPNPLLATRLLPRYEQIDQTGLELTAALGDWLWKLEAINNKGLDAGDYRAAVGGFEYTLVGIADSAADLGVLMEYHYDQRQLDATSPFQNDLFIGLRLTLNDFQSTELLAGVIEDQDTDALLTFIEANRRLGESFKLGLEARLFSQMTSENLLYGQREDDFIQLTLGYYY